ncbi:PREDICTED: probable mitochondrial import inner membrane translocase subunit TIM21 [Nelumbo nucifera]|uniref:Mitochondrial import inner membrane translocase subunit Tim21 n=1 Tax=Nelumbo nucifera TaxID=4432 RepID=A0A1U8Q678_NELNU|nr:PREDICTED: probable mitochondrial import inner membrane translocase subunit TIM21 [Nelumbo nucifera]
MLVKMHHIKYKVVESGVLFKNRWSVILKSHKGSYSPVESLPERLSPDVGTAGISSAATGRKEFNTGNAETLKRLILGSGQVNKATADTCMMNKDTVRAGGSRVLFGGWQTRDRIINSFTPYQLTKYYGKLHALPCYARSLASSTDSQSPGQTSHEHTRKDISTVEDPFDAPTYNIPEKPVTFAEGASYSVIILAGLGIAALAGYAVFKELIFEPKEYKIFGKALERVQNDSQVRVRIGSPVTGYGSESRNRAARQRIPNRIWTDEDGVEHVEVNFYIRGPHGAGKVYTEMFKDKVDKQWKFTYLIVEIKSPSPAQLMLESYVPA